MADGTVKAQIRRGAEDSEVRITIKGKEFVAKKAKKGAAAVLSGDEGWTASESLTIGGVAMPSGLPEDTVILTLSNPGCGYYWDGRRWIWKCY